MDKLEQLKKLLKDLSPKELEELKALLDTTLTEEGESAKPEEVKESEEKVSSEELSRQEVGNGDEEEKPDEEEPSQEDAEIQNSIKGPEAQEETAEDTASSNDSAETPEMDDMPIMSKGAPQAEETGEVSTEAVEADGEDIPVDFEQIIEAQNAKIAALEAENASLKSKVEGAFGYPSKISTPVKVNRLFDDCKDIYMHR